MRFTWKDSVGTLLVLVAGALTYALVTGVNVPIIESSWSIATLALLLIGMAAAAFEGYGPITETNGWMTYAVVLGSFGVVAAIAGVFFNSQFWFIILAASIFMMWAGSMLYHLVARSAPRGGGDSPIPFGS